MSRSDGVPAHNLDIAITSFRFLFGQPVNIAPRGGLVNRFVSDRNSGSTALASAVAAMAT